jgi:uncharacterized membrane protein YdjX (TVP38/TMEM64 family)
VVVSAGLGAALVPGPVLAATSGLLFGAATGTVVTIAASVLSALISLLVARRVAGDALDAVSGRRLRALAAFASEHGTSAVIVQRLAPGVPDAPASYVFGALGLRAVQVAVGTAIGSAPRAFSYTSIGASLDDPGSPLALAGLAGLVVTAVLGAELARRLLRNARAPGGDAIDATPRPR